MCNIGCVSTTNRKAVQSKDIQRGIWLANINHEVASRKTSKKMKKKKNYALVK